MEITETSPAFAAIQKLISDRERLLEQNRKRAPMADTTEREQALRRSPMIITSENWAANGRYIILWANPSNVQWSFKQRGMEQQTRTGYIQHYWRNSARSTFFDDPELNITFQTGNILPVRVYESVFNGGGSVVSLPPGLLDYYDFFDLLDDKKILSDGRANSIYIVYRSLLYPAITLRGFFKPDAGISITDDSSQPNGHTWTATFRVRASNPPFYRGSELANAWMSQFSGNNVQGSNLFGGAGIGFSVNI